MNYKIEQAKNSEYTLNLNDINIYSKYKPKEDAYRFIEKEIDIDAQAYFLIGLGLGYHLEALLNLSGGNKSIIVLALDTQEYELFEQYGQGAMLHNQHVEIITDLDKFIDLTHYQILIPLAWMRAIGTSHVLYPFLEDIKIRQMSYINFKNLLEDNFSINTLRNDPSIKNYKHAYLNQSACLISAGPSLDEHIDLLKATKDHYYILAVGSALKVLLAHGIQPNAVIITDAQHHLKYQFLGTNYNGPLFYLSTASSEVVRTYTGNSFIIYQEGFVQAEIQASKLNEDTIETGGSVATTAFSLLEYMGFSTIYLFGQDLGFSGDTTHAKASSSKKQVAKNKKMRKVESNNGNLIFTTSNLSTYHRWFEKKLQHTDVQAYNTAYNGAKIKGAPYISPQQYINFLQKSI